MAVLPNNILSDYDVRDELNKNGGKTDNVFGSKFRPLANINKWSLYKPVRYNKAFGITDAERASINYGFTIQSYTLPSAVYNAVQNGTAEWGYDAPTSGDYLRIGDFCGYDSSQGIWMNVTASSTTVSVGDTVKFDIEAPMDVQSIINTFGTYKSFVGSSKTSADFGFIIQSASSKNVSSALFYKVGTWIDVEDILSEKLNITVPNIMDYYSGTSFKFVPVLCSATSQSNRTLAYIRDDDEASRIWYPLSFNGVTLNVSASGSAELNNLSIYLSSSDWNWYDASNYVVQINSVMIEIVNGNNSSITLDSVTVGVTGYVRPGGPSNNSASLDYNGSKTIAANSTVYSELVNTDKSYGYGYMYEVATENSIGVTVTVQKGSTTKTVTLSLAEK